MIQPLFVLNNSLSINLGGVIHPVQEPLTIFLVLIGIILLSPFFFRLLKIPDIASFIIMGVLVGPYGFHILERDASIELLGTIGLLYIMFTAGLELNLEKLQAEPKNSVVFGLATFIIPFFLGFVVSKYLLQLGNSATVLVAIMFSTHTLVAYPIVRKLGVNRDVSVLTAVGGTIITDTLVLMILSMVTQDFQEGSAGLKLIKLVVFFALYTLVVLYTFPKIAQWFFKYIKRDRPVHYLFLLFMVCLSSFMAEQIGSEPIIGAFLAGLALNKSIPRNSLLMHHIDFVGNVLFIPVFLIGIGMLIQVKLLFNGPYLWYVTIILILAAFTGKWLAAWFSQKILKFSPTRRRLLFGLTCSHAAATIAIILVGYEKQLIDISIFNATIFIILISSLTATIITERSAKNLVLHTNFDDEPMHQERILVPIANPSTMANLLLVANAFHKLNQNEPVFLLNILNENKSTRENIRKVRDALEVNIAEFNNLNENLKVITRIDLNIASGIIRAAKEYMITDIVFGWSEKTTTSQRIFGTVFDHLFTSTQTLYALKFSEVLSSFPKFVVYVPENLEYEPSFASIISKISSLPQPADQLLFYVKNEQCRLKISALIPKKKKYTVGYFFDAVPESINDSAQINILFLLRKQSVSYHTKNNTWAHKAIESNQTGHCIIVVPGFDF
jgi:Kef-type K+ transport system membrane component KefB